MFYDKTPINWLNDSTRLILYKLARRIASSKGVMWVLENAEKGLGKRWRSSSLVQSLHRWIIGNYIYLGYRQGLRERSFSNS